jgi:hypothetical protein
VDRRQRGQKHEDPKSVILGRASRPRVVAIKGARIGSPGGPYNHPGGVRGPGAPLLNRILILTLLSEKSNEYFKVPAIQTVGLVRRGNSQEGRHFFVGGGDGKQRGVWLEVLRPQERVGGKGARSSTECRRGGLALGESEAG